MNYILYTYQTVTDATHPRGTLVCHAYGPTSPQAADETGKALQQKAKDAGQADLIYMVLPLERVPA